MMEAPDRLRTPEWELLRQMYIQKGNWPRLVQLWTKALLIFLAGNLATRIVGVASWIKSSKNSGWLLSLMLLLALIGLLLCLLLLQRGVVWNTIQFFYYTIFVFNILAGIALGKMINKLPSKIKPLLVAGFMLLSLPTSWQTLNNYYQMVQGDDYFLISNHELSALEHINNHPREGIVLAPFNHNAYVSTFSSMPVYFEDQTQAALLELPFEKRQDFLDRFFCQDKFTSADQPIFNDHRISYIYVPKHNSNCFPSHLKSLSGFAQAYENQEVIIYQKI
jgi:hypothetical protein